MTYFLIIAMMPMWLIGLVVFWYIFKPIDDSIEEQTGFDVSNRVNRFKLLAKALMHPQDFVSLLPWLKLDEGEK